MHRTAVPPPLHTSSLGESLPTTANSSPTASQSPKKGHTHHITIDEANRIHQRLSEALASVKKDLKEFDARCEKLNSVSRTTFDDQSKRVEEALARARSKLAEPTVAEEGLAKGGERHVHFLKRLALVGQEEQKLYLKWAGAEDDRYGVMHHGPLGQYYPDRPGPLKEEVDRVASKPKPREPKPAVEPPSPA
jgi:hypothetical protein